MLSVDDERQRDHDGAPKERWQHNERDIVETIQAGIYAQIVKDQLPLDKLLLKNKIGTAEYDAGMRFRVLWRRFQVSGPVVSRYGRVSGGVDEDARLDAQDKVYDAIRELGPEHAAVVMDVCVFDAAPSTHARTLGKRPAKGMTLIVGALEALARHWGYRSTTS